MNYIFVGYSEMDKYCMNEIQDIITFLDFPFEYYRGLKSKLCRIHYSQSLNKIVNLPFKFQWMRPIIDSIIDGKIGSVCFVLKGSSSLIYMDGFVTKVKQRYNDIKMIFHATDKIDFYKNIFGSDKVMEMFELCDLLVTYNESDAKKYNMSLLPLAFPNYGESKDLQSEKISSDLLYVGLDKGRHDLLHEIYLKAVSAGLRCDFTILGVPEERQLKNSNINYSQRLSYREVVEKVMNSKCILNIMQDGTTGVTARDYEAIGNNKLLLTNNYDIIRQPFYNEDQVILLDADKEIDFNKIKNGYTGTKFEMTEFSWKRRLDFFDYQLGMHR